MASTSVALNRTERIDLGRLLWIGPLAIIASVAANLLVRVIAVGLLGISPEFPPLQWGPPIVFTIIGVLGAVFVFAIVARFSRRPIRLFKIIAVVVLVLSFLPDIALLRSNAMPGTSPASVLALAVMHVVAWAISVGLLTRLAPGDRA